MAETSDDLSDRFSDLLFGVRRSARYHHRRCLFYDRANAASTFLALLFSSATFGTMLAKLGTMWTLAAAALVTIVSALDLVVGTSRMARLHTILARRFVELEKEIVGTLTQTEEGLARLTAKRLDIEADEPPILRVLDMLCHNELCRALGYGTNHQAEIGIFRRACAHFFDLAAGSIKMPSQGKS